MLRPWSKHAVSGRMAHHKKFIHTQIHCMSRRPILRWTLSFGLLSVYTALLVVSQSLPAEEQLMLTAHAANNAPARHFVLPARAKSALVKLLTRFPFLLPILLPHIS